jgi:hypothetical protein
MQDVLTQALLDALRPAVEEAVLDALRPTIEEAVRLEVKRQALAWEWRTPKQAGEMLGIGAAAVRQRARLGQLPATRSGGRLYFNVKDLDDAIRHGC